MHAGKYNISVLIILHEEKNGNMFKHQALYKPYVIETCLIKGWWQLIHDVQNDHEQPHEKYLR